MLVFDAETGPLPDCDLRQIFDDSAIDVPHPGEFDPDKVKIGNLKDRAKIAEKIAAARSDHEAAVATHATRVDEAKAAAFAEFKSRAALSATTGYIVCIGYHNPIKNAVAIDDGENDDGDTREAKILRNFWLKFDDCRKNNRSMVGLNIHDFDLPFIVRRCWILGVDVPVGILGQGRYWHSAFVDLRKLWTCGQHPANCKSSFDEIARAFGTGGKPNGINGGDFSRLWEEDREAAVAYLENDLRQPAKWAAAMGVC